MISLLKFCSKVLNSVLNLMFILQITLLILVFLTAAYWFFDLLNSNLFDFAAPIATGISDFVKLFYHQNIEVGGVQVDGSLLLFDIISLLLVFGITKSKYYIYKGLSSVDNAINACNKINEDNFNKALEQDVEKNITSCNNTALLVQLEVKSLFVDARWGADNLNDIKQKEEDSLKKFYAYVKDIPGCKFAKTDDKILILLNDFENIDYVLDFIENSINEIKSDLKKEKWQLFSYIAVEVFGGNTNFKQDVYPLIERLVALKQKNEALCLSNFRMRYQYKKKTQYSPFLRGKYNINGETQIWALVKKS